MPLAIQTPPPPPNILLLQIWGLLRLKVQTKNVIICSVARTYNVILVVYDILQTIQDVNEVVFVVVSIITRIQPTVFVNGLASQLRIVEVSFGHRRGANKNLPSLVSSERPARSDVPDLSDIPSAFALFRSSGQ